MLSSVSNLSQACVLIGVPSCLQILSRSDDLNQSSSEIVAYNSITELSKRHNFKNHLDAAIKKIIKQNGNRSSLDIHKEYQAAEDLMRELQASEDLKRRTRSEIQLDNSIKRIIEENEKYPIVHDKADRNAALLLKYCTLPNQPQTPFDWQWLIDYRVARRLRRRSRHNRSCDFRLYKANDLYNANNLYKANDLYKANNLYKANDLYKANNLYNRNMNIPLNTIPKKIFTDDSLPTHPKMLLTAPPEDIRDFSSERNNVKEPLNLSFMFDPNVSLGSPNYQIDVINASLCPNSDCGICQCDLRESKDSSYCQLRKCKHVFHVNCIDEHKTSTVAGDLRCPICNVLYSEGRAFGPMPAGTMDIVCAKNDDFIKIIYCIFPGVQTKYHQNPGAPFKGISRTCYLPNSPQGQVAALLLSELFMKGLTFTVGKSLTSGKENVVTWNDVHHKTSIYSLNIDPEYLNRLFLELEAKNLFR